MRGTAVVLFILIAVAVPDAQQPPRNAATASNEALLRGRVFDARDGAALPRARIVVTAGDRHVAPVFTDDRGRFVVEVPAASARDLRISKAGYATAVIGLLPGDARQEREIALARGAAIEGRVLNTAGAPVVAVTVGARREAADGRGGDTPPLVTETDDRGAFRFGGLPAGRYVVRVLQVDLPSAPVDLQNETFRQRIAALVDSAFAAPDDMVSFSVNVDPGDEAGGHDLIVEARSQPCAAPPAARPPDAASTAAIRGRITAVGGDPLACASVRLSRPGAPARAAATDAAGRYTIENLAAGAYTLDASLAGYVPLQYGQQRARESGTTITLRDGEWLDRIDVTLPRGSVIVGTIVDDHGEPMAGVSVRALELRSLEGRTAAATARGVSVRQTDDRGRYRLYGLLPGTYLVTASVDAEISSADGPSAYGFAPVYYPGTTDVSGAAPMAIDIEQEVNADLVFVSMPTARITGFAVDGAGNPIRGGVLLSVSHRSGATMLEPRQAPIGTDGAFTFSNVPYGDYVVQAIGAQAPSGAPPAPGGQPMPLNLRLPPSFGMTYVTVAEPSPPPMVIRTSAGATVEGRIRFEGAGAAPGTRVSLLAVPTDWDRSPAMGMGPLGFELRADGSFSYAGLNGSRRLVLLTAPDGWYLASIFIDGQDVTDRPFDFGLEEAVYGDAEIVISSAGAVVEGQVAGDRGELVAGYAVVVFPIDRTHWVRASRYLKFGRADQDGTFRVSGLPPGSYRVAAVDVMEGTPGSGEWQDPEVLEQLSSAAERVDLTEGDRRTMTLRLIRR